VRYPATFETDPKGGILVTFPDFGYSTHGDDIRDALGMARDLLVQMLSDRISARLDIPRPGKLRGRNLRPVEVPGLVGAKVALYQELRSTRVTKAELARRIAQPKQQVERLFDLRRSTRFDQIEAAFAALGKRLELEVLDAA
jgi:antitoxin HicB